MTEREALTALYQTQKRKLQRLESRLLKEPFRASELKEEITKQGGVIRGVGISLELLAKSAQTSFDEILAMEAK